MDKKASWRPQEAEKVPTKTFLDDFWAPSGNQEGPNIDLRATQIGQETPQKEVAFSRGGVLRRFKTRVDALR